MTHKINSGHYVIDGGFPLIQSPIGWTIYSPTGEVIRSGFAQKRFALRWFDENRPEVVDR